MDHFVSVKTTLTIRDLNEPVTRRLIRLAADHGRYVEDEAREILTVSAPEFIAGKSWQEDDALVLVSRSYQIDRDALAAALRPRTMGYLGMIGSQRKVHRVLTDLLAGGFTIDDFRNLRAPLGLNLGADHPDEIAVSIFAEILTVFNGTTGQPLTLDFSSLPELPDAGS